MRRKKNKTVWAYLDGEKIVDVVQAALDNHMLVSDMKKTPGGRKSRTCCYI